MMTKVITGGCMCGAVKFELEDDFSQFFLCYCEQCRKMTGSANASNLFTRTDNITWLQGKEFTKRYEHPDRRFSKVFCTECGSGLPYESKSGKALIVPAGSLDCEPEKKPDAQIFCKEQAEWHKEGIHAPKFSAFKK
ncbi:GFA family protein [Vibrio salinus]|uniref:GFA family protein n=1 Tax=Vibrio salinus TaxID=2899784 RepID=UPI001E49D737|nr:GFA family protein [Vibrio salinus]MCE0492931.1 GFA family protein [Vibrio salinus]